MVFGHLSAQHLLHDPELLPLAQDFTLSEETAAVIFCLFSIFIFIFLFHNFKALIGWIHFICSLFGTEGNGLFLIGKEGTSSVY